MFFLKITNILSLILFSDTPQWEQEMEFYFWTLWTNLNVVVAVATIHAAELALPKS